MADATETEQAEAMDTQASPQAEPAAALAEPVAPAPPADLPAAFPKKRRGRPPGRPNMTVREADYEQNPLVQAWNAAKSDRAMTVVPISIRAALTESALVHDTQRGIYRLPSREVIYFVQGWITARHIASQRPSYINGLLIHSRGEDAPASCTQCAERRAKHALGPFLTCRILPGSYHNSCSNCKWFDNTSACSLYTGPKPNRKRKAKESLAQDAQAQDANGESYGHALQHHADGTMDHQTPDSSIDPTLQQQQSAEAHYAVMQDEHDTNAVDAQLAAQLLPEIQGRDVSPDQSS